MVIINSITNTKPLIVHAAGVAHKTKEWFSLCENMVHGIIKMPEDVQVISFFYGSHIFPLQHQLDNSKIDYINAAKNQDIPFWQNRMKIKLIADLIKTINKKYVLILDGIDIMLAEDCMDIVDRFKQFNCGVLYNATKNCYPEHITNDIENSPTEWRYLNAGALIGDTDYVSEFYNDLMKNYNDVNMPVPESEQGRIRAVWKNYNYIKCDYSCNIFQPLLMTPYTFNNKILTVN
jgi:hypothetical protein